MKKRLVAWTASIEDITIGEIYNIVDGDFRDNVGDIRSASHGDWENVQQDGGDSVIKPGTIVDLTAVRDQAEYEEVCKAFMKAGADGHDGEWMNGNYPWQEWNYVGWDMDTGNLIHYDSPESFSEEGDSSDVREIAVAEVLQSVGGQGSQSYGLVRDKLESGYIVDFEGGGSAMFVPKAFNGQDVFIKANGECHEISEFDKDLRHPHSALNVVRIFDNMGGLGLGFRDNVASEGHYGRGVVWTRPPAKEYTFVNGVKVDKAKLEEFLRENQEG